MWNTKNKLSSYILSHSQETAVRWAVRTVKIQMAMTLMDLMMRTMTTTRRKRRIARQSLACPSLSGTAEDYWTTGLWGCGVSEKGPDPQWPPPGPAALPCRRCLGESPDPLPLCHPCLALCQVLLLIRMESQPEEQCTQQSAVSQGHFVVLWRSFRLGDSHFFSSASPHTHLLGTPGEAVIGWLAHQIAKYT